MNIVTAIRRPFSTTPHHRQFRLHRPVLFRPQTRHLLTNKSPTNSQPLNNPSIKNKALVIHHRQRPSIPSLPTS